MVMRDPGLTCPLFLTVPNSGNSLATVAAPIDPPDEDWSRVAAIVCQIIEDRLGIGGLALANCDALWRMQRWVLLR
jgi:hypothetical protein